MDWTHRLELTLRVFVKEHEDVSLRFFEVRNSLEALFGGVFDVGDRQLDDYRLPCPPESIKKSEERGLLLIDCGDQKSLTVRQWQFTIEGDYEECLGFAETSQAVADFAVIQVIGEVLSEVVAE